MDSPHDEQTPRIDEQAQARAFERQQALATGMLALPNLFLRSVLTLTFLYGLLTLVLITIVQLGYLTSTLALAIGVVVAVIQFVFGPWIMDLTLRWIYTMRWVEPDELPEHLQEFVERVCGDHNMKFPSFGIIDDGAPQAFTYGHHPSNARVVVSRGLFELLEPSEVEGVVAHELGHAHNWDMAVMTLANLVPLILFYIYDMATRVRSDKNDKANGVASAVAVGAYVLYIVSQYIVLWFSRTREYFADRFAGQVTGDPNALGRALVKIAYGLAAQNSKEGAEAEAEGKKEKKRAVAGVGPLGALNIFDQRGAVNLVMGTGGNSGMTGGLDVERVKGAMQWDLWNPWAGYYELNSTHPLVAKRLNHLCDQAAHQGQEPWIVFDREKPESYWDDFLVDVLVMFLPMLGMILGIGAFVGAGIATGVWHVAWIGVVLAFVGLGGMLKTHLKYRTGIFPNLTVAALMGHVKVSPVRPVLVTLTGKIIGKGVPGLIWSEDFVIRDQTGILFLDYNQPLALWGWLFGLLRAGQYQGKEVRVEGWFRRAPVPYLELNRLEVIDGSLPSRACYASTAARVGWMLVAIGGFVLAGFLFMNG